MIQKKANPVPKNKTLSTKAQKGTKAGTEAKLSKRVPEHKQMYSMSKQEDWSKLGNGREPKAFKTELIEMYS